MWRTDISTFPETYLTKNICAPNIYNFSVDIFVYHTNRAVWGIDCLRTLKNSCCVRILQKAFMSVYVTLRR
jgi:hypothetical protein